MRKGVILFSSILALGAFLFLFPVRVLTLAKDHQAVFLKPAEPGDTFQLAYLHSVARSDVREYFTIDSEYHLVLTATRFQGQGTGLPYNAGPGEEFRRDGDWFQVTGMRRITPSIAWRVQSEWHNRFRFGNGPEADISASVGNALIYIRVQKMNLASYLATCLQERFR